MCRGMGIGKKGGEDGKKKMRTLFEDEGDKTRGSHGFIGIAQWTRVEVSP